MRGCYSLRPIPGPDPGACPDCGGWIRAGMAHDCNAERERIKADAERIAAYLWPASTDGHGASRGPQDPSVGVLPEGEKP